MALATLGVALLSTIWEQVESRSYADPASVKTFGTGHSAFALGPSEQTIFEYTPTQGSYGVITHFWITGGAGIDNATVRFYVDGEGEAAIEFKAPQAAGVGFDDKAAPWGIRQVGLGVSRPLEQAPPCRVVQVASAPDAISRGDLCLSSSRSV
jgi:hypothetical protein